MVQKTVDHFCGMGKYSSQRFLSQKPFLIYSTRWMMTYSNYMILLKLLGDNVFKINSYIFYERTLT